MNVAKEMQAGLMVVFVLTVAVLSVGGAIIGVIKFGTWAGAW